MADHPRIAVDPDVLTGKPVIRGARLSVEFVIGLMADGWTEADILQNYPAIVHDDIIACLAYTRDVLSSNKLFPNTRLMSQRVSLEDKEVVYAILDSDRS